MLSLFNRLFPLWAILFSSIALLYPSAFIQLKPSIIYLLAFVMFGMGISLTLEDFLNLSNKKKIILLGLILQFTVMPATAWLLSQSLQQSVPLITGMILVGSCPGGTASNIICYLARGNVALSITLTCLSTFLAIIATPFLTWLYLGQSIDIPVIGMMLVILKIIILPVMLGVLINHFFAKKLTKLIRVFPSISIFAVCLIIAIIVALNKNSLQSIALLLLLAVVLHNLVGLASGYFLSAWLGYESDIRKTLAIEVGMQNSGLAVALATEFFKPLAALPGAIFSIWHNLSGAALASFWAKEKN